MYARGYRALRSTFPGRVSRGRRALPSCLCSSLKLKGALWHSVRSTSLRYILHFPYRLPHADVQVLDAIRANFHSQNPEFVHTAAFTNEYMLRQEHPLTSCVEADSASCAIISLIRASTRQGPMATNDLDLMIRAATRPPLSTACLVGPFTHEASTEIEW